MAIPHIVSVRLIDAVLHSSYRIEVVCGGMVLTVSTSMTSLHAQLFWGARPFDLVEHGPASGKRLFLTLDNLKQLQNRE